jgi:hypothetical protein
MISGPKTRSVFDRYDIPGNADFLQTAERLEPGARTVTGTGTPYVEAEAEKGFFNLPD